MKGYDPGGTDWRKGKGNPPLHSSKEEAWDAYLQLWRDWADSNIDLMRELYLNAVAKNHTLSDMFATTPINQARALSEVLNEFCGYE